MSRDGPGEASGEESGLSFAEKRDAAGGQRDAAGEERDRAGDQRDAAAEERIAAAEQSEELALAEVATDALDRSALARRDAAVDRSRASLDRGPAPTNALIPNSTGTPLWPIAERQRGSGDTPLPMVLLVFTSEAQGSLS